MNYLLYNACIFGHPHADAILIIQDSIYHIGKRIECNNLCGEQVEEIDIKGKMVLPAFTDAHTHFVEYSKSRLLVNLLPCKSIEAIEAELLRYRKNLSWDAKWILGGGWNRNALKVPEALNKHLLDKIFPDIPVALFSKDYHAKLLNTKALSIAGWDSRTPDPAGGKLERMSNGELSGVILETATEMIDQFTQTPDAQAIVKSIKESVSGIYELGLIGFHAMESRESATLLQEAQNQGSLFRVCWHFQANELDLMISSEKKSYEGDEYFKIGGLKLFGDGSLGSRTAAMFDPYPGDERVYGILRYEDEDLYRIMEKAAKARFASTIHAIGDRCTRQVIDAVLRLNENSEYSGLFHRIEHVQSIRMKDIPDLKRSGLFASLQPVHIANDVPMIHQSWGHIKDEAYAFRTMINAGIPYAFGSDVPIESINPFYGIYSAIRRKHKLDPKAASFNPSESITAEQAIMGYSLGAAQASRSEMIRGKIDKGFLADLIVVEDYRMLPDEYWLEAKSLFTMISGKLVLNKL